MVLFIISILLNFAFIPLITNFAKKNKLFDEPNKRKQGDYLRIRLGGISLFASTFLSYFLYSAYTYINPNLINSNLNINLFFLSSFLVFFFGLADDFLQLSPFPRLGIQFGVATITWCLLLRLNSLSLDFGIFDFNEIRLNILFSYIFTVFWIVGIINAINWLDGLDGLASGFSFIIFIALIIIPQNNFSISYTYISISLAGACLGFLFFNLYPSKIIMGDCGSNFLGYSISTLSLISSSSKISDTFISSNLSFFPILILFIPILDMLSVIIIRLKKRKSPFFPDRSHFHHRLLDLGLNVPSTAFLLLGLTEILTLLATFLLKKSFPFSIFVIYLLFDMFILLKTKKRIFLK